MPLFMAEDCPLYTCPTVVYPLSICRRTSRLLLSVLALYIVLQWTLGVPNVLVFFVPNVSFSILWMHQFFRAQPFCGPILASVQDYWTNYGFDYMHLLLAKWCLGCHSMHFKNIYLLILFLAALNLVAMHRAFLLAVLSRGSLHFGCGLWAFHCRVFSCCRAQAQGWWDKQLWQRGLVALLNVGLFSQIRDQTFVPCIGKWIVNHWPPGKSQIGHYHSLQEISRGKWIMASLVQAIWNKQAKSNKWVTFCTKHPLDAGEYAQHMCVCVCVCVGRDVQYF